MQQLDAHLGGARPFGLSYWPLAEDDPGVEIPRESIRLVSPRRRAGARRAVDAAGRHAVEDGRHPQPSAWRLQRALRLPAAGRRRLRGARLRHALHEQRHRLPARELHRRREDGARRDAAPRRRGGGAAGQLGRRQPDGDGHRRARHRRRLDRHGRAPRRGRVHAAGDRPQRRRRERSVRHGARARHVQPRQRLAAVARAVLVRPRLAGDATAPRRSRASRASTRSPRPAIADAAEAGGRLRDVDKSSETVGVARAAPARGVHQVPDHLPHAGRPRVPRPVDRPRRAADGLAVRVPRSVRRQLRPRRAGPHDDRAGLAQHVVGPVAATPSWPTRCRR